MEEQVTENRSLVKLSKIISGVFSPFVIPFGAFVLLFFLSPHRTLRLEYKLIVLAVVYCFTVLIPLVTIYVFRKVNGFESEEMADQNKRYIPYLLTIVSYVFCGLMMHRLNMPWYMTGIIWVSIMVMLIFTVANIRWKLSEHMGGIGALVGGLVSFSAMMGYNPVFWLCAAILVAGLLGSARIILQRHTLGEVLNGFTIGLVCSMLILHPLSTSLLRFFLV